MALSAGLGKAGITPTRISTEAKVNFEKVGDGFSITRIDLVTEGEVPGIDEATFVEHAEDAKKGCPISRALARGRDHAHRETGVESQWSQGSRLKCSSENIAVEP